MRRRKTTKAPRNDLSDMLERGSSETVYYRNTLPMHAILCTYIGIRWQVNIQAQAGVSVYISLGYLKHNDHTQLGAQPIHQTLSALLAENAQPVHYVLIQLWLGWATVEHST